MVVLGNAVCEKPYSALCLSNRQDADTPRLLSLQLCYMHHTCCGQYLTWHTFQHRTQGQEMVGAEYVFWLLFPWVITSVHWQPLLQCIESYCPDHLGLSWLKKLQHSKHFVTNALVKKVWYLHLGKSNPCFVVRVFPKIVFPTWHKHHQAIILFLDQIFWQIAGFLPDLGISQQSQQSLNPKSNGFAEAMANILKGSIQKANHSGSDPHLALLDLHATPIDAQLPSTAELLYQCHLHTTWPYWLKNTNPSAQDTQDHMGQ